jgi:iron(III) transport system permease protein
MGLAAVGFTLALVIVAFLVLYPLFLLIVNSFEVNPLGQPVAYGLGNWTTAFNSRQIQTALWNTISLSFTRQFIAIIVGVVLAWLLARTDLPGRGWIEFGFWVAVFLPTLTVTLGWIMLFDGYHGLVNQALKALPFVQDPPFEIFSWWGIIFVHLVTGTIPVKVMLLTPAFRNLDSSFEEASRASGASTLGTLLRIAVPILAPTILVVTVLGTIRSLEAFEIELILGSPAKIDVYSTLIYRTSLQEPPQFGQATVLSMVILAVVLPAIAFQQWFSGRRNYATMSGKFKTQAYSLGRWRWPIFALVARVVFMMKLVPVARVFLGTFMKLFGFVTINDPWTMDNWRTVLGNANFIRALMNSIIISFSTAVVAMLGFFYLAYLIVRTRFAGRGLLDFLVWLPSTLPGIVIGLGYLWLFLGTPFLRPVYGTTAILVIVAALGSITLTTQILKTSLMQLGSELEEASWASGAAWWYTLRRVVIPLIAPSMAVVGVLAFATSARATSHVALLSTNSNRPLSMLQLDMMADNNFEAATVVGVFILLLTVGVAAVARLFGLRLGTGSGRV